MKFVSYLECIFSLQFLLTSKIYKVSDADTTIYRSPEDGGEAAPRREGHGAGEVRTAVSEGEPQEASELSLDNMKG